MKIAFVTPYPRGVAPSQRFRFEQYFPDLQESGIDFVQYAFLSPRSYSRIYKGGFLSKSLIAGIGFTKRIFHLFGSISADLVFIHREATPVGPPWFEFFLAKIFHKRIVYDFDDAIWLPDQGANQQIDTLKSRSKVGKICRWSYLVSVGNNYLASYASDYKSKVTINPTVVDTEYHSISKKGNSGNPLTLGWTGSHTTAKFLEPWLPFLDRLQKEIPFKFIFISNQPLEHDYPWIEFVPWNIDTEIEDLLQIDIGIMPIPDNSWSHGKCGFKIIQYMSTGIIAIGSPVGVNNEIIEEGVNGFFLKDENQLRECLINLTNDNIDREQIRVNARATILEKYSRKSQQSSFLDMIKSCLSPGHQDK